MRHYRLKLYQTVGEHFFKEMEKFHFPQTNLITINKNVYCDQKLLHQANKICIVVFWDKTKENSNIKLRFEEKWSITQLSVISVQTFSFEDAE